jgi:hypothetical protein
VRCGGHTVKILGQALRGFLIGALATVPMSAEFWGARRVDLIDELPPHKAIRSVAPQLPEPRLSRLSALAHLAIGGGAGTIYAIAVPRMARGLISGMLFGVGVWIVGYEAIMPAATHLPPAHRDKRGRAGTILLAHLIYGAVLGVAMPRGFSER